MQLVHDLITHDLLLVNPDQVVWIRPPQGLKLNYVVKLADGELIELSRDSVKVLYPDTPLWKTPPPPLPCMPVYGD